MLKVNASAAPNVQARSGAGTGPAKAQAATAQTTATATPTEPAAILNISAEGRERSFQLKMFDPADPNLLDKSVFEAVAQKKAEDLANLSNDPNFFELNNVGPTKYTLSGLVEGAINSKLDAATASKFTSEIDRLIRNIDNATGSLIGTVEERTVNREKGIKLAEYIAENYIDEPADRQVFLEGVKHFVNIAEMRDKGYTVVDTLHGEAVINQDGGITGFGKAFSEAFTSLYKTGQYKNEFDGALFDDALKASIETVLRDPKYKEIAAKYDAGEINLGGAYLSMSRKSDSETASLTAKFAENEKTVANTIEQTKKNLDKDAVKKDVQKMINDILSNTAKQTGFLKNMLNPQA
jgi:hypothetical protein